MALTFYMNPMSRARIARWMLEETGVAYDTVVLEFADVAQADFRAINPMGKVPTIVHDGRTVTETAAICAYLADAFPQAGLAPAMADRSDYYRWLFFAAGPLEQAIVERNLGVDVPADKRRMVGYGSYDRTIDTLESAVAGKAYVAAGRFTAADVYVGSHIAWGLNFGTIPKRPAFVAYLAGLSQRIAYRRAAELDDRLLASNGG